MSLPERLQQTLVTDFLWIKNHKDRFGVTCASGADFFVSWIGRVAAGIADRGHEHALTELPEFFLSAPETTQAEDRGLQTARIRSLERMTVDEMAAGGCNRR